MKSQLRTAFAILGRALGAIGRSLAGTMRAVWLPIALFTLGFLLVFFEPELSGRAVTDAFVASRTKPMWIKAASTVVMIAALTALAINWHRYVLMPPDAGLRWRVPA